MERVCQFCGVDISGTHVKRKFCSGRCKDKYHARRGKRKRYRQVSPTADEERSRRTASVVLDANGDRTCAGCGARFRWKSVHPNGGGKPPMYCTLRCRKSSARKSEIDRGYRSPLRARRTCQMCGESVYARRSPAPKRCDECRAIPSSTPLPEDHWGLWYGKSSQWEAPIVRVSFVAGNCDWCGESFVAVKQRQAREWKFCSRMCGKRHGRAIRRARKRGAYVADVRRYDVFIRDDWRCHICKRKVSKVKQVPHPRAATIDHLIPLSQGGTHEPANVATACFECNCTKSDGAANDQLALVG